jgi:hypothetical protein
MQKGRAFKNWIGEIHKFLEANTNAAGFEIEFKILKSSHDDFGAMMDRLQRYDAEGKQQMMPLFATRILHAASMLYCGALILDQGLLARKKLRDKGEGHFDAKFYKGKIGSAQFYIRNVLPQVSTLRQVFEIGDTTAIELEEDCFG